MKNQYVKVFNEELKNKSINFNKFNYKVNLKMYENKICKFYEDKKHINLQEDICNEFAFLENESMLIYEKFLNED